jgi:hypothetical protein
LLEDVFSETIHLWNITLIYIKNARKSQKNQGLTQLLCHPTIAFGKMLVVTKEDTKKFKCLSLLRVNDMYECELIKKDYLLMSGFICFFK